jgi:hypothetical protein
VEAVHVLVHADGRQHGLLIDVLGQLGWGAGGGKAAEGAL